MGVFEENRPDETVISKKIDASASEQMGGLPVAALAAWAATVAIINQHDYGYLHVYVWLLTVLWVLSVLSAVRGLALQRRAPSTEDG